MGFAHEIIYDELITGIKCRVAIVIYLLYGLHFFPSDAAESADTPRAPGYSSEGTL